jgi:hypothetical protein
MFIVFAWLGLPTSIAMLTQFDYGTMLAEAAAIRSGFVAHVAIENPREPIKSYESGEAIVVNNKQ